MSTPGHRNLTPWFEEKEGFAKREFAERRATEVIAHAESEVRWFIYPLPNGRFLPVILYNEQARLNIPWIATKGCAVIN
jgi:hypothetical protein